MLSIFKKARAGTRPPPERRTGEQLRPSRRACVERGNSVSLPQGRSLATSATSSHNLETATTIPSYFSRGLFLCRFRFLHAMLDSSDE